MCELFCPPPSPPPPPPLLFVQVWHKDLFLTDDFLGHVTIPLKDVAVQKWDDDVDAPPPGECCFLNRVYIDYTTLHFDSV